MKKLFLLLVFSLGLTSIQAQTRYLDSLALVDLYNSTAGASWSTPWDLTQPITSWHGVVVTRQRVSELSLYRNNLVGTIPNFSLTALISLRLNNNQLSGSIPNLVMPALQWIYLEQNQLSGTIPNFTSCGSLQTLSLHHNQLSGAFPDLAISSLQSIVVNHNQLSETVPNLSGSTSLMTFVLSNNQLTFEDLLYSHSTLQQRLQMTARFQYRTQDSVGTIQTVALGSGSTHTIDLVVDDTVTTNIYYWYKDGVLIDTILGTNEYTINNFQAADAGVYTAQITNSIVTEPVGLFQNLILHSRGVTLSMATGSTSLDAATSLEVSPNPVSDVLSINAQNIKGDYQVQLINLQGQILEQLQGQANTTFLLPMSSKPAGLYIVQLIQNGKIWQQKVIKE